MILKCAVCKLLFDAQWRGDEIQTICDDCWKLHPAEREAKIIEFRRPA